MILVKIRYNKNEEKEMKTVMGFEPAHSGKQMDFLLSATYQLSYTIQLLTSMR